MQIMVAIYIAPVTLTYGRFCTHWSLKAGDDLHFLPPGRQLSVLGKKGGVIYITVRVADKSCKHSMSQICL